MIQMEYLLGMDMALPPQMYELQQVPQIFNQQLKNLNMQYFFKEEHISKYTQINNILNF